MVLNKKYRPVALVILDGWGIAPATSYNGITLAEKPVMDRIEKEYYATTLQASGEIVGLEWGEWGNSEVGHMNMGAGFTVFQEVSKINNAIRDGSFFRNEAFCQAIEHVRQHNSALHIMGLVSSGKVHSYNEHLFSLIDFAKDKGISQLFIHAWLDGRDTPPKSGLDFIRELEGKLQAARIGQIDTLSGRFYAMDRDEHWERIKLAYEAMVKGQGRHYPNAAAAITDSYQRNVLDENFVPAIIDSPEHPYRPIQDNDAIIFFNYRPDRAREICQAFLLPGFNKFSPTGEGEPRLQNLYFAAMNDYGVDLPLHIAFHPQKIEYPLARILSDRGLKQIHAAETEKFAHVTSFFDGGNTKPFPGEEYLLVHSRRDVDTYDQAPEMSAITLTDQLLEKIAANQYDFILLNFANPDMVAHTGNIEATKLAITTVDTCLGRLLDAIIPLNGAVVVTADHGNAEQLRDPVSGEVEKEHSSNPIPFAIVAEGFDRKNYSPHGVDFGFKPGTPAGVLTDIAPTVLELMGLERPSFMTGRSLIF